MKLIDKLKEDRIQAFKTKESIKKNILGCLISDSTKQDKQPDDSVVYALIKKYIENCQLVIEKSEIGSSSFFQASMEIDILESYQPEQLTEEDIRVIITNHLELGMDFSGIMKEFKRSYPNQYDGKLVSTIAKEMI
jgi:uncharacterized protein YqeY